MTTDYQLQLQEEYYNKNIQELEEMAQHHIKEAIENEMHDVILHRAKKLTAYVNAVEKGVKSDLLDKINGEYYSTLIDVKESSRLTLDYEKDEVYKELSEKLKARKKLLDASHKLNKSFVDEDTGEIVPIIPVKSNTSFLTIKLK